MRSMVKLIHADGFFSPEDVHKFKFIVADMQFTPTKFGAELLNFNLISPDMEEIFCGVIGEKVKIDEDNSGIFRRPIRVVHFEDFKNINEWSFVVALERTTFNIYHHLKSGIGESNDSVIDASSALDGTNFNYYNLFEWNIETNIILQPNQGVFFRPWLFHSLENGLVQYFRLIPDTGDIHNEA